jgi:hypothetical protein
MVRGTRLAAAVVALMAGFSVIIAAVQVSTLGRSTAALPGTTMPLQEFVNDGAAGRLWNAYNQTATSAGPTIDGRPSPIDYGTTVHVYARSSTGDLTEFVNDGFAGRPWNAYDLTRITQGPTIAADPGAAFFAAIVHVYAEAPNGDLIEFVNDGHGGRLWNAYDLTSAASGPTLGGDPTPIVSGTTDRIFARSSTGDLVEYVNDGANGQLWNAYDLTTLAQGTPVAGDPNPVLYGTVAHVYAESANGDLTEFANDGANGRTWNQYDLTIATKGPTITGRPSPIVVGGVVDVFARSSTGALTEFSANNQSGSLWNAYAAPHAASTMVSGDPSAVAVGSAIHVYAEATGSADLLEFYNSGTGGSFTNFDLTQITAGPTIGGDPSGLLYGSSSVHVYAGGPQPADPPGGVGLYGLTPPQTPQAIEDNWPIIADTGALGTQSAPYTGINLGNDLSTGQSIQASGRRVTWLSFWTVSGPVASNADGSACYTSTCYYNDGYGAGQYVADTIDAYPGQGLSIKPDYVILDPEGYPDNQSGLVNGPGASDTNWSSFLTGWAQGLSSVDPALHPGFYADQYEYNTFDLAAIQLPAFVAIAFPDPTNILQNPSNNIAGFIAFGATCPASNEEQTLLSPPWDGTYNTLQFSGADYCAP